MTSAKHYNFYRRFKTKASLSETKQITRSIMLVLFPSKKLLKSLM